MRILLMVILLSGCGFSKRHEDPTTFKCAATCHGCENCIVDCYATGRGATAQDLKVEGK